MGVYEAVGGLYGVCGDLFQLGVDLFVEVYVPGCPVSREGVEIALQFCVGYFISRFVFAVVYTVFLDGIICQMNFIVLNVLQAPEVAGGPHVALLVPVGSEVAVVGGDQHVGSDVEFSAMVQQRVGDVLLDD